MLNWLRRRPRLNRVELLERWFASAAASGSPRGLSWVSHSNAGDVVWAKSVAENQWLALIPVAVQFEPLPGSELEDVPQAREPRGVIAVFRYLGRNWVPDERAIFNLTIPQLLERSAGRWIAV